VLKRFAERRAKPKPGESLTPARETVRMTRAGKGKARMTGGGGTRVSVKEMSEQQSVHGPHPSYHCHVCGVHVTPPREEHIPHAPGGVPSHRVTQAIMQEGAHLDPETGVRDTKTIVDHPARLTFLHSAHPGYEKHGFKKESTKPLNDPSESSPFRALTIEHINDKVCPLHSIDRERKVVSEGPVSEALKREREPSKPPHVSPLEGPWGKPPRAKGKPEQPKSRQATSEEIAARPSEKEYRGPVVPEPERKPEAPKAPAEAGTGQFNREYLEQQFDKHRTEGNISAAEKISQTHKQLFGAPLWGRQKGEEVAVGFSGKTGTPQHKEKLEQQHKLFVKQGKPENAAQVSAIHEQFFGEPLERSMISLFLRSDLVKAQYRSNQEERNILEKSLDMIEEMVKSAEKSYEGPSGEQFGKPVSQKTGQGCVSEEIRHLKKEKDYPQERAVAAALNICGMSRKKSQPVYVAL